MNALMNPLNYVARGFLIGTIPSTLAAGGLDSPAGSATVRGLAFVTFAFIARIVLSNLQGVLARALGNSLDRILDQRVMRSLNRPAGLSHLEDPKVSDQLGVIQGVGTVAYRPGDAVSGLAMRVSTWLAGLGAAILLAGFRWWLAVALSVVFLWAARVTLRDYLVMMKVAVAQAPTLRRGHYYRDQAFVPPAGKEVRIFGLGDWFVDRFRSSWFEAMGPIWKERAGGAALRVASIAMSAGSVVGAVLIGFAAINREINIGDVALYLGALGGLYSFGQGYGPGDLALQHGLVSLPVIREFEEKFKDQATEAQPAPRDIPKSQIRFDRVSFTYPGTSEEVLSNLDLEIPAGRSSAIVGVNGAGKTTIVKLLCRFYEPTDGRILVDDVNLASLGAIDWQPRVAAIFQDFIRYELTARENISFGSAAGNQSDESLRLAAERAGVLGLIEALPKGWDTVLSRRVTDGVDLSGGEWQRVALARALFAVESGARILVLDEPTANLDVRAEAELYSNFLELVSGITTVLISHRFSTVRRADVINVLEEGRVIEKGSHAELMALNGRYAHMFSLQASRFVEPVSGNS